MISKIIRIVVGALLTVPIVVLGMYAYQLYAGDVAGKIDFETIALFLMVGYVFMGVQSIIYSLIMEFVINPKIKSNSIVLSLCSVLGLCCGSTLIIWGSNSELAYWSIIGLIAGMLTGGLLRYMYLCVNSQK